MTKVLMQRVTWRLLMLVGFESALMLGAVALSAYVRLGADAWRLLQDDGAIPKGLLVAVVSQLCLYYGNLYDRWSGWTSREIFVGLLRSLGAASLILGGVYFWFPTLILGRGVFAIAAIFIIVLVIAWRLVFTWVTGRVGPGERLLLVGTTPAAVSLARELFARRHELGVEIVGFIDPDPTKVGTPVINPGVIGALEDIPLLVRSRSVDRVVVSLVDARGKLPMEKLLEMKLDGVAFDHLASVYEEYTGKIAVETLRPSWLIFSSGCRKTRFLIAAKRSVDLVAASLGLILGLPLMLVLAAIVKLTSNGPALYHQQRVGRQGHVFMVHKIRSMRADAEAKTGAVWASENDLRATVIGRFMRRARLDELPQLWNVLRGDMSLVGPRPERPEFVRQLKRDIPFYELRHGVRPGLTGWAQVKYTYTASTEQAMEKLQYDLFYIKNMTVALDLFILIQTVKTVLLGRGA